MQESDYKVENVKYKKQDETEKLLLWLWADSHAAWMQMQDWGRGVEKEGEEHFLLVVNG